MRKEIRKKILCCICAASIILAASGCGKEVKRSQTSSEIVTGRTSSQPDVSEAESQTGTDASGTDTDTETETGTDTGTETDTDTDTTTTTTAPEDTTTTTTTTTVRPDPVPVDNSIVSSTYVWFSELHEVTDNERLRDCVKRLDEYITKFGAKLGFSYENMETGIIISYNATGQFWTCSTIKAPYVKSILAQDNIDLDEMITIGSVWLGAAPEEGHITAADQGKQFSVKKLIENTIMLSDNTAYNNLVDRYGREVFNNSMNSIGASYYLYSPYIFTKTTADNMRRSYKDIYQFAEENEKGKWLVELMTKSVFNEQIGAALGSKYPVAQKYGTDNETVSYSDCAICYAPSPFVLCIYTTQKPETEEANAMFKDLALIFDELNEIIVS